MAFRNKGTVEPTAIVSLEPDRSGNFVCDGTADDVQIQAAIDYAMTLGNGKVYIKKGEYQIAATINVVGADCLTIMGENGAFLVQTGNRDTLNFDGACYKVKLERLYFKPDSERAYTGYAININTEDVADVFWEGVLKHIGIYGMKHAIRIAKAYPLYIYDLEISDSGDDATLVPALYFANPSTGSNHDITIRDLLIEKSYYYPIQSGTATNDVLIDGFHIEYGDVAEPAYSIYIGSSPRFRIMNGVIHGGTTYAVYLASIDGLIENVRIGTCTGGGITLPNVAGARTGRVNRCFIESLDGYGVYANISKVQVTNCQVGLNGNDGIRLDGASDSIVTDNFVFGNTGSGISVQSSWRCFVNRNEVIDKNRDGTLQNLQDYGIAFTGTSSFCECMENQIHNSDFDGVYLSATASNNRIENNVINDSDRYGINITAGGNNRNIVKNNTFSGNITAHINDSGTDTITHKVFKEVTDPDSNVGDHPALVLPDTVDTTFRFQVEVPLEFQQLLTAQVIVTQLATAGPPNMQWSTTTDWGKLCAAENYNAGSDAETDQTTAVTINQLNCIDVSGSLTGIAAGDLVGFTFIRRASQGGDTINADVYYLGFRLRYV